MQQEEFFEEVESLDVPEAEVYLEDVREALNDYFIEQPRPVEDKRQGENLTETLGREFSDMEVETTATILAGQIEERNTEEYFDWLEEYRNISLQQTQSEEWITQYDSEETEKFAEEVRENIENEDPVMTLIDSVFIPVYERDYRER